MSECKESEEIVNIEASMPQILEALNPMQQFEKDFFDKPWEKMTGATVAGVENLITPEEKAAALWESIKPSLDIYIQVNNIPTAKLTDEDDSTFLTRLSNHMYGLNQQTKGCWKDCWPTTALEVKRTNCALGSLVLARALTKADIPEVDIEYATPGPLSHAAVVVRGLYVDQANGVVVPIKGTSYVDGIKCYDLDVDETNPEIAFKVPFRLIPVSSIEGGLRALVANLDPMIEQAIDVEPNPEAVGLLQRFGVGTKRIYGDYAFSELVPPEWNIKRMRSQPEWIKETQESGARINEEPH